MKQIVVPYTTKEDWLTNRHLNINSTEAACLFDAHKYKTKAELWYDKRAPEPTQLKETLPMKIGNLFQSPIAELAAGERGWSLKAKTEYIYLEDIGAGSSFDYELEGSDAGTLLEVKNMSERVFEKDCIVNGENVELPLHYEIQAQWEMWVSGYERLFFALLVGGRELYTLQRRPDDKLYQLFLTYTNKFWDSIERNQPPEFNFQLDAELIARLHGYAEPGKVMDADDNIRKLADRYHEISLQSRELEAKRNEIKSQLLIAIGDNEKVKDEQFTISAGMIGPAHLEYDRAGYRNFKINFKKEK